MRYRIGLVLPFVFLVLTIACKKNDDTNETEDNFDRKGMLTNLGNQLIIPGYNQLYSDVNILSKAANQFVTSPDSLKLDSLRFYWTRALEQWQNVSMFEFGPAETVGLHANVNLYPTNVEQIENNIKSGVYDLEVVSNLDAKGFQALDYMLNGFGDSTIIKFTTDSLFANRKAYLTNVTSNLLSKIKSVSEMWSSAGGNYLADYISNAGTDKGSSISLTVNALSKDFERYFRDGKIGIPAGVRTHTQTPLPEKVEAFYNGKISLKLAKLNFQTFRNLIFGVGKDGVNRSGFDDYLNYLKVKKNNENLSSLISKKMDEISLGLNSLNPPLKQEVVINQAKVIEVFNLMQDLIVLLKVDMASSLGVTIIYTDNDGD